MNKNRRTLWAGLVLTIAVTLAYASAAPAASSPNQSNATQAFEKLKGLVGQWEATTEQGKASVTYELIANGTSLLERENMPNHGEMVTLYHLAGAHLVLTHYCEAGNQPSMQAEPFDPSSNEIHFNFVGATNLASANAGHMHQVLLKFYSSDELTSDWTWRENGKPGFTAHLQYHRVR